MPESTRAEGVCEAILLFVAPACGGLLLGLLLLFGPLQVVAMLVSPVLCAHWAGWTYRGERTGLLARLDVGLAAVVGFAILVWVAFLLNPDGGLTHGNPIYGSLRFPRVVSLIVCFIPAVPFAADRLFCLVFDRGR